MKLSERKSVRLIVAADRIVRRCERIPRFLLVLALCVGGYFAGAALGRLGHPAVRVVLGVTVLLGLLSALVLRREEKDEARMLESALAHSYGRLIPGLHDRSRRALALLIRLSSPERMGEGSVDLAEHHLFRMLDAVSAEDLLRLARAKAKGVRRMAWLVLFVLGAIYLRYGLAISEGTLALFAQRGVAPLSIAYAPSPLITATLPEYTRQKPSERYLFRAEENLPMGSEIRIHFSPNVERAFVVRFGETDYPLESDGHGALVAHFTLKESGKLTVGAKLGSVLISAGAELLLVAEPDAAPRVLLEGAPRSLSLVEMGEGEVLSYHVSDDYGLSEVSLVMKSGQREERKRLADLDSIELAYDGVYNLKSRHPFLARAYLPVSVTIEAKDGNRYSGSGSGSSEALMIVPPAIGELEAESVRPLYAFRSSIAAELGAFLESREPGRIGQAKEGFRKALTELEAARGSVERFSNRELQFLELAVGRTLAALDENSAVNLLLSSDVLVQSFAQDKAGKVAKRLGALVREESSALGRFRESSRDAELSFVTTLQSMAERSAHYLGELGRLGRDLGGVATGDLARVKRLLDAKDYLGAERAALHLAMRLERGNPSFGAKSSRTGGRGGGESGVGASGGDGGDGQVSDAPTEFEQSEQAREKLAQDHAKQLSELERLLQEARQAAVGSPEMSRRLSELADKVRDSVLGFPLAGPDGTSSGEAARARQSAEAMADSLSEGDIKRAVTHGRDTKRALSELKKRLADSGGRVSAAEVEQAERAIEGAMREAEELKNELERSAADKLGGHQGQLAKRESELAERTKQLLERSGKWLSEDEKEELRAAGEAMEKAARDLKQGSDEGAREAAEKAQSALERALSDRSGKERSGEESKDEDGDGSVDKLSGDVPETAEDKAREFRKRVRAGLSRTPGALAPFVAKYAGELE